MYGCTLGPSALAWGLGHAASLGGSAMRPRPSCPRYMQYMIYDMWYLILYNIFDIWKQDIVGSQRKTIKVFDTVGERSELVTYAKISDSKTDIYMIYLIYMILYNIYDMWYMIYDICDIIQYMRYYTIYAIYICDIWWYLGQPGRAKRAPKRGPKARASMHLIIMIYDCFWEPNMPSSQECTDVRSCLRHSLGGLGHAASPQLSKIYKIYMICNIWYLICDMWYMWYAIYDIWYMICDIRYMWYYTIYLIFENKI